MGKSLCLKNRGVISVNMPGLLSIRLDLLIALLFLCPEVYFNEQCLCKDLAYNSSYEKTLRS